MVGIRPGPTDGTLLVTIQSQGVTLFDIATQSTLSSWHSRTHASPLTHAACFEPLSAQLLAVRGHTELFGWAEASTEMSFRRSHTLPAPVLSLFHHPALLDGTLAMLTDGTAVVVNSTLDKRLTLVSPPSPKSAALWADLSVAGFDRSSALEPQRGLVLTQLVSAAGELQVVRTLLTPSGSSPTAADAPLLGLTANRAPLSVLRLGSAPARPLSGASLTMPAAADSSGKQLATLALMWDGGELQLWDVPLFRAASAESSAAAPTIRRQLRGVAKEEKPGKEVGKREKRGTTEPARPPCGLHVLRPRQVSTSLAPLGS